MLTDLDDLDDGQTLRADFVVVGTGIAGSEVARQLWRHGRDVLILESGRAAFDAATQALNDIAFLAKPHRDLDPDAGYHRYLAPELRGVSRVRQFGGTSNVWTGKWKWLQETDFPGRPWVAHSEWPLRLDDLAEHYRSAAADYGFGDLEAEGEREEIRALRRTIAPAGLKMTSFYWEKTPLRTAARFGPEMAAAPNVRTILGATVTELRLDATGRRVERVSCRSLEGRRLTVHANTVVLATGALETARLLLVSDGEQPGGIGNRHDLVGRFYTDHPKHHTGTMWPGPLTRRHARELQYGPKPRFCLCFALADDMQAEHRLLEHVVYVKPLYERPRERIARVLRRRPACRDGNGVVAAYRVKFVTEQEPSPDSRIGLSSERDALGVRKPTLEWRFTDLDRASIGETVRLLSAAFARSGLGDLDFAGEPPDLVNTTDAAHQMGTTRMASDPRQGVVDPDCRVFDTDNLYIAGSAVFPTGPSYSPTFTILALARRLGLHLATKADATLPEGDHPTAA